MPGCPRAGGGDESLPIRVTFVLGVVAGAAGGCGLAGGSAKVVAITGAAFFAGAAVKLVVIVALGGGGVFVVTGAGPRLTDGAELVGASPESQRGVGWTGDGVSSNSFWTNAERAAA